MDSVKTLYELASSASPADKQDFRIRFSAQYGGLKGCEWYDRAETCTDLKYKFNNFIYRYPSFGSALFRQTEQRVGPAEYLMCYLFDNITLNYNNSPDLKLDGKPTFECKVGRMPKRGEWAGYAIDFTMGSHDDHLFFKDCDALNDYHIQFKGVEIPGYSNKPASFSADTLRYLKELPEYPIVAARWSQSIYRGYIEDKQFLLFDTKSKLLERAGTLKQEQLSVYRVHTQIYAGVNLSN